METCDFFAPELRFTGAPEGVFSGYASVFDTPHQTRAGVDIVRRGAFAQSLRDKGTKGVKLLWQHDASQPIGRWLTLSEDTHGLRATGQLLLDVARAKEAAVLLREGILDSLSIGYALSPGGFSYDPHTQTRTIHEVDLWEISLVTFPADQRAVITEAKHRQEAMGRLVRDLRAVRVMLRETHVLPWARR